MGSHIHILVRSDGSIDLKIYSFVGNILGIEIVRGVVLERLIFWY
jgi:hypothetical protein